MSTSIVLPVLPPLVAPFGKGKISHPTLGTFDYSTKPDQWLNVDSDVIIKPTWTSTRTLSSGANVLWQGNVKDVLVTEKWNQALAMPVSQLRMLLAIYTNPVDPSVGYCQWFPNYVNNFVYNVIPQTLSVGGSEDFVFDDIINALDQFGLPDGWISNPVTFAIKIVSKAS